jgi:hypothetical protein
MLDAACAADRTKAACDLCIRRVGSSPAQALSALLGGEFLNRVACRSQSAGEYSQ